MLAVNKERVNELLMGLAKFTASEQGVKLLAYDCIVTPESMVINKPVEIRL